MKRLLMVGSLVLVVAALFLIGRSLEERKPFASVEVGIAELSPAGVSGGKIVPASGESGGGDTASISAGGTILNEGGSTDITWSCSASASASGQNFSTGGATSGTVSVSPEDTTTYTVQCSGGGVASVVVTVNHPSLSLSASPTRVRVGNASTITWSATEVTSCVISGPGLSGSGTSGSQSTGPLNAQSTYTLTCETEAETSVSASVLVAILPAFDEF